MECPLIELRKVSKFFPGVIALNKADLKLYSGEVHGLMGFCNRDRWKWSWQVNVDQTLNRSI